MQSPITARCTRAAALGLVGWFALCFTLVAIGARASIEAGSFYGTLLRPSWAPPAWLFGPAWTLFVLQLVPNTAWSWLFFAAHSGLTPRCFKPGKERRGCMVRSGQEPSESVGEAQAHAPQVA